MQQNYIRLLESGIQELEPSQWRILRGGQADLLSLEFGAQTIF